jgi:GT2 family glycosyltransferase
VSTGRNIGAAARNYGALASRTRHVAFCDDDTWWHPGSIQLAAGALDRHPRLAVVNARILIGAREREDPTCTRMQSTSFARAPDLPGFELFGFLAGACMMRRTAFLQAGGYHPMFFIGGEEDLLAIDLMSAGWRLAYVPEAIVHHHPSAARDSAARRALLMRNAIWCAWMRRPWRTAALETARALTLAHRDRMGVRVAAHALLGLPRALCERRAVSAEVEAKLRLRDLAREPMPPARYPMSPARA